MGSKKVKAVVVDLDKIPPFSRPPRRSTRPSRTTRRCSRPTGSWRTSTPRSAPWAWPISRTRWAACRCATSARAGRWTSPPARSSRWAATTSASSTSSRGGEQTHACMPGCVIQCSNVYADANGKEVVSPVEYETLGLLGTNCGLTDPDDLAQMNYLANDLGVDTIELGAMIAVLMEAGLGRVRRRDVHGRVPGRDPRRAPRRGAIWAQGTARVGEHYRSSGCRSSRSRRSAPTIRAWSRPPASP